MSDKPEKQPSSFSKWLDISFKLASTLMILASPFIINSYESKMSATTMLSQREEAESTLRASMFNNLIGPLMGSGGSEKGVALEREQLLVELLVLNFDEHFEAKPLLMHIDKRISAELPEERQEEARRSLRSVAHRVISRQIASLLNEGTGNDKTSIESLFVMTPSLYEANKEEYAKVSAANKLRYGQIGKEIPLEFPDKNYVLTVKVDECDWKREMCEVSYTLKDSSEGKSSEEVNMSFQLTAFDFPLTDNTLLADGNRFAMVLDGVSNDVASLKVIWFPKAYFTPRERPINYGEIRSKLNLR